MVEKERQSHLRVVGEDDWKSFPKNGGGGGSPMPPDKDEYTIIRNMLNDKLESFSFRAGTSISLSIALLVVLLAGFISLALHVNYRTDQVANQLSQQMQSMRLELAGQIQGIKTDLQSQQTNITNAYTQGLANALATFQAAREQQQQPAKLKE